MESFQQRLSRRLGLAGPVAGPDGRIGEDWRLDYLFSVGSSSWVIHLCVTSLATIALVDEGAGRWALAWYAAMTVFTLAMMVLAYLYHRKEERGLDPDRLGRMHTALIAILGLLWGGGAIAMARAAPDLLTFYSLVLGGTALGAVSSQHVLMRSCMTAVWTSIPLLGIAFLVEDVSLANFAVALMMLLFGGALTILALRLSSFVTQNVTIRTELADKVSRLTEASASLEEAHAARSRFLAQASHDLRQPIHAIGLFVECLSSLRVGREGRQLLSNIDASIDSLARLCRALLDLSALDVGKVRPRIEPVPLGDVLGEVVRQSVDAARDRGIEMRLVRCGLWVETDGALLHTMVQNLVSNAIKYAPRSRLLVGARRHGSDVAVEIIDSGPGIAPQDHERIFFEFVQLEPADGREPDGLGLGLSIVRRLADLLGLSLRMRSAPGSGTRFTIAGLSRCAPAVRYEDQREPVDHAQRLRGLRVLVIDDDKEVLEGTARMLSRWGCSVRATRKAPDTLSAEDFDLVICDHELGDGVLGSELMRSLASTQGDRIGIALITGSDAERLRAENEGSDIAVLAKPVRPAQLRSVLLSTRVRGSASA